MKNLLLSSLLGISLGLCLPSCNSSTQQSDKAKGDSTSTTTNKSDVKAPDFPAFFESFKTATASKDYSKIDFPLFSGGLDQKTLSNADLAGATYQQIFTDMRELPELSIGDLKEAELDPYLKDNFTKKYGSLSNIKCVQSSGPEYFYAYFGLVNNEYKLIGIHYVPGGM